MELLRPLLLAVLGAFVAAAPAAPLAGSADQKAEQPRPPRGEDRPDEGGRRAPSLHATELGSGSSNTPLDPGAAAPGARTEGPRAAFVRAPLLRPPFFGGASPLRDAGVRAGLLSLPPPVTPLF